MFKIFINFTNTNETKLFIVSDKNIIESIFRCFFLFNTSKDLKENFFVVCVWDY